MPFILLLSGIGRAGKEGKMKQRKDFDTVKSRVYNCIGTGSENAVSRYELTVLTGIMD